MKTTKPNIQNNPEAKTLCLSLFVFFVFTRKNRGDYDKNTYYLFLIDKSEKGILEGIMPYRENFGYIFANTTSGSQKKQFRAIAHELGHGAFDLEHNFSERGTTQGKTPNLMDYSTGTVLRKYQWEFIHNPKMRIFGGSESEVASDYCKGKILFVNGHYQDNWLGKYILGSDKPKEQYWGDGFTQFAQDFFKDKSKIDSTNFIDGSSMIGGDQSGEDRFNAGYEFAKVNLKTITSGMQKKECFKLVTHSEGAAYGAGVAEFLINEGYIVEEVIHLSADEGDEFTTPEEPFTLQLGYEGDFVTGNKRIDGVDKFGIILTGLGLPYVHGSTRGKRVFEELEDLKIVQTEYKQGMVKGEFKGWYIQLYGKRKFTNINGFEIKTSNGEDIQ